MFIIPLASFLAAAFALLFARKPAISDDDRIEAARRKIAATGARIPRGSRREARAIAVMLDGGDLCDA